MDDADGKTKAKTDVLCCCYQLCLDVFWSIKVFLGLNIYSKQSGKLVTIPLQFKIHRYSILDRCVWC